MPRHATPRNATPHCIGKQVCSLEIHYNIHHTESVCARLPGVIRQILTHHAYTALYLLGSPVRELTVRE